MALQTKHEQNFISILQSNNCCSLMTSLMSNEMCLHAVSHKRITVTGIFCVVFPRRVCMSVHTEALAQIGLFVDKDFGRHHVSERHEHL